MERVRVTRNYQMTIPASVRRALGIREGDVLKVYVEGDKFVVRKVEAKRPRIRLGKPITPEAVDADVEKGLDENFS